MKLSYLVRILRCGVKTMVITLIYVLKKVFVIQQTETQRKLPLCPKKLVKSLIYSKFLCKIDTYGH